MNFPPITGSAPIQANRLDSKAFHSSDDSVAGGFEEHQPCILIGDDAREGSLSGAMFASGPYHIRRRSVLSGPSRGTPHCNEVLR